MENNYYVTRNAIIHLSALQMDIHCVSPDLISRNMPPHCISNEIQKKLKPLLVILLLYVADWRHSFQAVVHYMEELVAKRDAKAQPIKVKKTWAQFCFFSRPNKRKHDGLDYIKA